MTKRVLWGLVHGLLGVGMALGATAALAAEQYTLNIGHVLDPQHPVQVGGLRFAQVAAEKSGGRIKVNLYPSSQLGSDREALQNTQSGVIQGTIQASTSLVNFVPEYGSLDLPYLVKTQEDAYRFLDGPVVRAELIEKAAKAGFHVVHHWEVTFRNIYTPRKQIRSLADLKGLKIRVIPSPSFITLFRALGASPTPMAFGELYTALQQGTVDGAENDLITYHSTKHFEVAKNLAITRHIMLVNTLFLSEKHWNSYPPEIQKILIEASLEGRKALIENRTARETKVLEVLKASGVQVTEPDLAPFIEVARKTYPEFEGKLGKDLVRKVTEALK
jgi:tripartite ATP-independent transporter DctP family solute receptor